MVVRGKITFRSDNKQTTKLLFLLVCYVTIDKMYDEKQYVKKESKTKPTMRIITPTIPEMTSKFKQKNVRFFLNIFKLPKYIKKKN